MPRNGILAPRLTVLDRSPPDSISRLVRRLYLNRKNARFRVFRHQLSRLSIGFFINFVEDFVEHRG